MSSSNSDVGYPIRVVARRTGLKPDVIRAWERRYRAVAPGRSKGRHRLYSEEDIRRLQLLRRATEAGHSIGRIADLEEAGLLDLLQADAADRTSSGPAGENPYVASCLAAIAVLDEAALESELRRATVELGRSRVVDEVLAPLVEAVGRGYEEGSLRPMHEHLASSVVSSVARGFRSAFPVASSAPGLVVATPVHQHHEIGAVLAASVASSEGWRTTYLGGNLPAEEIAAAARATGATAVALSIVYPPDDGSLEEELRALRGALPGTPLLVGGRSAEDYEEVLAEIGAVRIPDFAEFRRALAAVRRARSS